MHRLSKDLDTSTTPTTPSLREASPAGKARLRSVLANSLSLRAKVATALVSAALALVAAELAARRLHGGAFPYLNIFEPDARYGVRLAANASAHVRSPQGRITEIATNARGFRGPEWPEPPRGDAAGEPLRVLVLGDSQMLGYGVAVEDATPAALERVLAPRDRGAVVRGAAVPTWGPGEYALALEELAPAFRPRFVVFVANAANDWLEL